MFKNNGRRGEKEEIMEILKVGKIPREQRYVKKCYWCKSILVYNADDIKINDDFEPDTYITCPICERNCFTSIFDKKYKPRKRDYFYEECRPIGFDTSCVKKKEDN